MDWIESNRMERCDTFNSTNSTNSTLWYGWPLQRNLWHQLDQHTQRERGDVWAKSDCDAMHRCQTSYLCYSIVKMMFEINFHVNKCHMDFSCSNNRCPWLAFHSMSFFKTAKNKKKPKWKRSTNPSWTHTQHFSIVSFSSIAFTQQVICSMVI